MLIFWRIRFFNRQDKQFNNRDLYLDTNTIDPLKKNAIEALIELRNTTDNRKFLQYRRLFPETAYNEYEMRKIVDRLGGMNSIFIPGYFEDEDGCELTPQQLAVALTGNPSAVMVPHGAKLHDIEFNLADKRPIDFTCISLSDEQLQCLGYFVRDLREMIGSSFFQEGSGILESKDGSAPTLRTAVTDEEVRSFATIYRRLYMEGEPANFIKAAADFSTSLQGHPLSAWMHGAAAEYKTHLSSDPVFLFSSENTGITLTNKRLIDIHLYTQYAHQPDDSRSRQYKKYLKAVNNQRDKLTWLFLAAIWASALHIRNAGVVIADFYDQYCRHHEVWGDVLPSIKDTTLNLGVLEKNQPRHDRILLEGAKKIALQRWEELGQPSGGYEALIPESLEQLKRELNGGST